MLKNLIKLY